MQAVLDTLDQSENDHPIGHSYCLFEQNPHRCLVYVNIPKNASSWAKHHMTGKLFNYVTKTFYTKPGVPFKQIPRWPSELTTIQYLVILRDPIDRWITGLAQYLQGWGPDYPLHVNNIDWNMVFDQVMFDSHTQPQCDFIQDIDHSNTTWLRCDETLAQNFAHVLGQFTGRVPEITTQDQDPHNVFNVTKKIKPTVGELFTTELQQNIVNKISAVLDQNPSYRDRLQEFYKKDIELFNSVKFFTL
jgi:hypothetical protein